MNPPSDLELKRWLAEQLSERIHAMSLDDNQWFVWTGTDLPVRDTEWLEIVRMVEKKLNHVQKVNYTAALWKRSPNHLDNHWKLNQAHFENTLWWSLSHASWQQRATALNQVMENKE